MLGVQTRSVEFAETDFTSHTVFTALRYSATYSGLQRDDRFSIERNTVMVSRVHEIACSAFAPTFTFHIFQEMIRHLL